MTPKDQPVRGVTAAGFLSSPWELPPAGGGSRENSRTQCPGRAGSGAPRKRREGHLRGVSEHLRGDCSVPGALEFASLTRSQTWL